jgi:hypothetical protein
MSAKADSILKGALVSHDGELCLGTVVNLKGNCLTILEV